MTKKTTTKDWKHGNIFVCAKYLVLTFVLGSAYSVFAQSNNDGSEMINQFIKTKGYTQTIVFSPENIKQYWIDKSVFSQDKEIKILLHGHNNSFESVPLSIQLANVDETLDCKVDVISADKDFSFNIMNSSNKKLSSSVLEDDFINYKIASTKFHLEDALDSSFKLQFSSTKNDILPIKKIILSFEENKQSSYLRSPGKVIFGKDNLQNSDTIVFNPDGSFSRTGVYNNLYSNCFILVRNNTISYSAKVTNTGNTPVNIYAGYVLFAKGGIKLDKKNYPYNKLNKTAEIVSAQKESTTIVIDSYLEGAKDCFLSLNAKEDLSDIPSLSFANGKIVSIKQLDNGQAEIMMSEPLKADIEKGTKCRVNGKTGSNLYPGRKTLQPGASVVVSFEIKYDSNLYNLSTTGIPSGVYCVQPILFSHSQDTKIENTVQINDFSISY